jgi:alpha-mannosidase
MTNGLEAETRAPRQAPAARVVCERARNENWTFAAIPRPSRSDVARHARITVADNEPAMSCLSLAGLCNGVLPREGKHARDFFAFSCRNADDGTLVMDLGEIIPVAAVAAYSWHGVSPERGWGNHNFDGCRGPQVYTLFASAATSPDAANLNAPEWTKLAEVDTRPGATEADWTGQYASLVQADDDGLLGHFRWLAWRIRPTFKPGKIPAHTATWFAELDVHTPETLKNAGDAILAGAELEEIVVVFKTHFDIGFTHPAPEIVNVYRTSMIDHALALIDESKAWPPDQRFTWTVPSWVLWQILWPGQDNVRRERIVRAVKEGSLAVHALPVTLHTESLDLEDLAQALDIHTRLAKDLGIPLSRAGKMTDVPSHSWILPTLLKHAGVDFLHLGCNPGGEKPDLPLLYNWEGPDGSRLLTFHNQGYGTGNEFRHISYPPADWPYKHWLALFMTSDNEGPPSRESAQSLFAAIKRDFPDVRIRLGRMEDFADAIRAEERAGTHVPVVRTDMPDFWIHGIGSNPGGDALAHQVDAALFAAGALDASLRAWGLSRPDIREQLFSAYERRMMYGEHTWGGSKNLHDRNAYTDPDFAKTVKTDPLCRWLQQTWNDHAAYIEEAAATVGELTEAAMQELAGGVNLAGDRVVVFNPLPQARDVIVEIPGRPGERFVAKNLPAGGYRAFPLAEALAASGHSTAQEVNAAVLENAFLKITVDRARGGISSIIDKGSGRELVDGSARYAFGQYLYQRFDRRHGDDYFMDRLHVDCVVGDPIFWNVRADLPADAPYVEAAPVYERMTLRTDGVGQTVELCAPASGIIASRVTTTITLPREQPWLEIAVRLEDKPPDYWPENGTFVLPVNAADPRFRVGRLGAVVDPTRDYVRGSSRAYGYVNTGAIVADADGVGVAICPLDHGLMSFGEKGIYEIDPDYVPTTPEARVSIFNNLWTINFPYWIRGDIRSRVRVWATHDLKPASLIAPALDARCPALAAVASGPDGTLPVMCDGLAVSRPGLRATCFAAGDDGSLLLRLWEQAGESGRVTVTFPPRLKIAYAQPVNLRGEKTGERVGVTDNRLSFDASAYAPASFMLFPMTNGVSTTANRASRQARKDP